ncbi:MAG: GntR family transcriptional regulator [bacterium]|nr:GntR family transcriptional regulator [bacterium]
MLFYVDPGSGVPIFRQLMDQVRTHVAGGVLKPGDEMPSIRSLSVPLGVNPMTISKAYNLLVHEGVLERRPGLPLVVAEHDAGDLADRRREQLRASLAPAAQMAYRMGVEPLEAEALFRELLAAAAAEEDE